MVAVVVEQMVSRLFVSWVLSAVWATIGAFFIFYSAFEVLILGRRASVRMVEFLVTGLAAFMVSLGLAIGEALCVFGLLR